ncbi:MAG: hypothetical protein GXP53_02670 [Deltaproteobacteria bacterium]|nr:hypothetical protein [Deltaproteobacteria bacterium]
MRQIATLIMPRLLSFGNGGASAARQRWIVRVGLFGAIGVAFWAGMFAVCLKVLFYFKSQEEIGNILAWKLLSMVMVIYFSLLVFSGILTCLSKLYISKDLLLVFSLPVSAFKIFIARWIEAALDSSWMIIIYTLPVLISYGIVYSAGFTYYLLSAGVMILLSAVASLVSAVLVMVMVIVIPAGRVKSIFVFLGLTLFLLLYLAFRLLRPERFVDPEAFRTVMVYMKAMQVPASPLLPSTWAFNTLKFSLTGNIGQAVYYFMILVSCSVTFFCTAVLVSAGIYFKGMSKTQTARQPFHKPKSRKSFFFSFLPRAKQAYIIKEIKMFLRDQTQWSQVFLIAALIFIYVYNFKVLPLERAPINTVYLQNLLSFLNMGLATFVLTAVAGRFAYPAVSAEGEAFWLVRSAPVSIRTFLWIKFFIYLFPLLVLTEVLIVMTNIMLKVTPAMMGISTITVFFMVPAVVGMAIGLGATYPDFNAENPTQVITSFGGLIFMMASAAYIICIIMLEAGPVYRIFISGLLHRDLSAGVIAWSVAAFGAVIVISVCVTIIPMWFGERALS